VDSDTPVPPNLLGCRRLTLYFGSRRKVRVTKGSTVTGRRGVTRGEGHGRRWRYCGKGHRERWCDKERWGLRVKCGVRVTYNELSLRSLEVCFIEVWLNHYWFAAKCRSGELVRGEWACGELVAANWFAAKCRFGERRVVVLPEHWYAGLQPSATSNEINICTCKWRDRQWSNLNS